MRGREVWGSVAGQHIAATLRADAYHVLHLSAHGSATAVELEDEDRHDRLWDT